MKKILNKMSPSKKLLLTIIVSILVAIVVTLLAKVKILTSYHVGILITACINIILVVSLNLTTGFLGQLTLGHAGFMAIGAYGCAYITKTFMEMGIISFPIGLLFGGILAALSGVVIGVPALRLRGDYLAIITLAFGEVIRTILLNMSIVGGSMGYMGIPNYTSFAIAFLVCVACIIVVKFLIDSKHGRAIISIAEDEIAADASGINTTYFKILAFIVASFMAGIAGGLYANQIGILMPGNFNFNKSINILVMVVLGGMGSITGSIISALVLTILPELLKGFADYWMLMYSAVLIIAMLLQHAPFFKNIFAKVKAIFKKGDH